MSIPCILSTGKPWGHKGYRYDSWRDPHGRRYWGAHRVALAKWLWAHEGRGILPGHHACHKCNQPACIVVGVGHLYEGTPAQNEADKRLHGRARHGGSKLTPAARADIRATYRASAGNGTHTQATVLARRYQATTKAVWEAATGRTWAQEETR